MKKSVFFTALMLMLFYSCSKEDSETVPELTTSAVNDILYTTANCGGTITSDGNSKIINLGLCWSETHQPTKSDHVNYASEYGTMDFTSKIYELSPQTEYFIRAFATNKIGTNYGEEYSFTTKDIPEGVVLDYDDNIYHSVNIGDQEWLVENLKTSHYRNGSKIINIQNENQVYTYDFDGTYCYYENKIENSQIYGNLYNYYTIENSHNICPTGWHVPDINELQALFDFVECNVGKLKEEGTRHWAAPNLGATNETGFTALPSGSLSWEGFSGLGYKSVIWVINESFQPSAGVFTLLHDSGNNCGGGNFNKNSLASIRCVKD